MEKVYLYPLWLRIWHWFNAFLFLILIISGVSMHYSNQNSLFMPFQISMVSHNIAGILISIIYIFYFIRNIKSGNYKHYIPKLKGFIGRMKIQGQYYISGIFNNEPHPFETNEELKFNPLQQATYFGIMFLLMPLIIITGWFMLFPQTAPDEILGMGGVWPMAILHIVVGFFLSMFMVGHIYLATTGDTILTNFISMINGWHLHSDHGHDNSAEKHIKGNGNNIDTKSNQDKPEHL